MIKIVFRLLIGGIKRAFTSDGGSVATITDNTNQWDAEASIALLVRGLIGLFLAWIALKLGVDPNTANTFVQP